jgi:cytochrome P450
MPATSDPTAPSGEVTPFAAAAELFSLAHRPDPYPVYRKWRERTPVARLGPRHVLVSGHAEAVQVLGDAAFGHPTPKRNVDDRAEGDQSLDEPVDAAGRPVRAFISLNPPDHTRLRRLVSKAFTSRTVEHLTPRVEELADEMITNALNANTVNLIDAIAMPLPVAVISDMLGVPPADRGRFAQWSRAMARGTDPDFITLPPGTREIARQAKHEFIRYFRGLAAQRRRDPMDDLLSELVAVSDAGYMLSEGELLITLTMLLTAGHETITNLIGNGIRALLAQPDQFRTLAGNPALTERAVEEVLRYDAPAQLTVRTALKDTAIGDIAIAAGTSTMILIGAANHDPAAYPNPAVLDITREPGRHLAFGHGVHFCLGAALARLEGRTVLRELARRAPAMRLTGEPHWNSTVTLRGLTDLPVTLA